MSRPAVLVIAGPTASGKTEASLALAEEWEAVIVSADAMQVYRHMDIGTAKATLEERARVQHFGIDLVDPTEAFDAADFAELADQVIAAHSRVIVTGGSYFYIRALLRGLVQTPDVDPALRAEVEAIDDLHGALAEVDPALAARLHPHDRVRLVRGVEVYRATGQRLSELQVEHAQQPDRVDARGLWFDRENLRERIGQRVHQMMAQGYVDEVRDLLDRGYERTIKPMRSLGYRHLSDHLLDGLPLEEATRRTIRDTHHFSRKQRTWLRKSGFERTDDEHLARIRQVAAMVWG